ncbi:probable calcium-binding protein CML15 [Salvia miltiorrhiza]|uniref:probable calcium-binding protein CML15 n=1 Tax=Salvia miltiorrhiza TaxID=226208 RepID=UPI0025ACC0C5|nr:probable calcium-binding protein CML15 [Salvia miltiorrhiza]
MVRRSLPIFGFSLLLANMDANGNGYITAAEIAGQMAKMGHPLTYRELSDMMQEADTNGDGVISLKAAAVGGGVGQIRIGGWLAAKAAAVGGGESGFDPSR